MSRMWTWFAVASIAIALPHAAGAQDTSTLTPSQLALGCAPPPTVTPPTPTALRIAGSQDVVRRSTFGGGDLLVITGGANAGVVPGQRYYVRRVQSYGGLSRLKNVPHITQTTGWVHIVSANDTTAIAVVDHACNVMTAGDYLEPFTTPVVMPVLTDRPAPLGDLDFSTPGHVLFGDDERTSVGIGDFALIDRGAGSGRAAGTRLAIYRDLRQPDVPLASIGEAVVVAAGEDAAVVRIVRARDAVYSGDLLIPEKR